MMGTARPEASVKKGVQMERLPFSGDLARTPAPGSSGGSLYWLGQAGFLVDVAGLRIAIDPYLSNSLATKYAGTETPHDRMMPVPVSPTALDCIDFILCTHRHTDHMDPETVRAILAASPQARLVAPRAALGRLREIGAPEDRLILVNAGDTIALTKTASLSATASAHEALDVDANGDHPYLGYAIRSRDLVLYHSGDCAPYEGLSDAVTALGADLALLPINGRDPVLSGRGIAGNFWPEEAAALCRAAGIPNLIFHHFGMFAFNSADPDAAQTAIAAHSPGITALPAAMGTEFRLAPNTHSGSLA